MHETQSRSFRQQVVEILELNVQREYSAADVVSDLRELVERKGPNVAAVRIVHQVDKDPNLLWLGEYEDAIPSGVADWQVVDREEKGDRRHGERRYFVGGANYVGEPEVEARKYALQDYARMESYNRGEWTTLGISVEADVEVKIDSGLIIQTVASGGLWGVESDGDDAHRREVAGEQLAELQEILSALDVVATFPPLDELEVVERY